jgi:hypothetical protein
MFIFFGSKKAQNCILGKAWKWSFFSKKLYFPTQSQTSSWYSLVIIRASCGKLTIWHSLTSINMWLGNNTIKVRNKVFTYLGRNSVTIERFGARVTAPMKRTTFGCLSLFIIRTLQFKPQVGKKKKKILKTILYILRDTNDSKK